MKRGRLRSGKPPVRRTGIKQVSDRRPDAEAAYAKARLSAQWRARGACEAGASPECTGRGVLAHHVRTRHPRDDSLDNLLWLCDPCHRHIHANPAEAYDHGWLRRHGA